MIISQTRLTSLLTQTVETIKRFPLTFIFFAVFYLVTADMMDMWKMSPNMRLLVGSLFFALPISIIFSLSENFFSLKKWYVVLSIPLGIALHYYFFDNKEKDWAFDSFMFCLGWLFLLYTLPFLFSRSNDKLFYYWSTLSSALRWAAAGTLIFACGLTFSCFTIAELFDLNFKPYETIWRFSTIILFPLIYLSSMPYRTEIDAVHECRASRGIKITATWLLIPFSTLFLGILYAYFMKLLIVGGNPKVILVSLIATYSVFAVFVYLGTYPLISEGNKLALRIQKYTFPALIIPCGIFIWRLAVRILDQGWTGTRIYAAIFALWLTFNIIIHLYLQIRQRYELRIPVLSAALIALAVSLSPLSPGKISLMPFQRDMLKDNKDVRSSYNIHFNARSKNGESIVKVSGFDYFMTQRTVYVSSLNSSSTAIQEDDFSVTIQPDKEKTGITVCDKDICDTFSMPVKEAVEKLVLDRKNDITAVQSQLYIQLYFDPIIIENRGQHFAVQYVINDLSTRHSTAENKTDIQNVSAKIYIKKLTAQ